MKPETTTTDNAVKKDIQKLQRAIVDGLEDVKAQDIQVFNTEHLSPLFERVVIASGTSNRQTKALAVSVRDAVREAGFAKPRTEGEDNGEWIIVDCGPAVVHVMQPAIRQYYHLEDLWGDKPLRVKHGAEKPVAKAAPKKVDETSAKPASAKSTSLKRSSAAKKGAAEAFPSKAQLQKAAGKTAGKTSAPSKSKGSKSPARKAAKPAPKVVKVNAPKPATKSAASKSAAAKPTAKKAPTSKLPAQKAAAKKVVAKKAPAKKAAASKSAVRKR